MIIECAPGHFSLFRADRTGLQYCSPPERDFPLALPGIGAMRIYMGKLIYALHYHNICDCFCEVWCDLRHYSLSNTFLTTAMYESV